MIFKDYYKILGLESNKANAEEIRLAFREQAKKYHPDVNNQNVKTEERFKDINEAYKILSSNTTRRKYDRQWNVKIGKRRQIIQKQQEKQARGNIFSEFSYMLLGKEKNKNENIEKTNRRAPKKGENIETEINVNLEDAYFGLEKKISLRAVNGKMKTFSVKVPAGIRNGEKIRLLGQGKQGINGGKNGDLFIRINIEKNNKFKLEGSELITDLYITPWEAALGKRVTVPSIEENVSLYIPPGVQSGERVKIAGKGYKNGQGTRGDLVAEIKTVVPKKLTEEEKELFEKLKEISKFNPRG